MAEVNLLVELESDDDLSETLHLVEDDPDVTSEIVAPPNDGGVRPQVDPVTAILIGAAALGAAQLILTLVRTWRGGMVLDRRHDPARVSRSRSVDAGWLIVIPADGDKEVVIHVEDAPKNEITQLLESIVNGVLKSATDIAAAAKKVVASDEVVEQPASS